jgi:uncharacterized protein (DUF2342 family)
MVYNIDMIMKGYSKRVKEFVIAKHREAHDTQDVTGAKQSSSTNHRYRMLRSRHWIAAPVSTLRIASVPRLAMTNVLAFHILNTASKERGL